MGFFLPLGIPSFPWWPAVSALCPPASSAPFAQEAALQDPLRRSAVCTRLPPLPCSDTLDFPLSDFSPSWSSSAPQGTWSRTPGKLIQENEYPN